MSQHRVLKWKLIGSTQANQPMISGNSLSCFYYYYYYYYYCCYNFSLVKCIAQIQISEVGWSRFFKRRTKKLLQSGRDASWWHGYPKQNFFATHLYASVGRETERGMRNSTMTEPDHQPVLPWLIWSPMTWSLHHCAKTSWYTVDQIERRALSYKG